MEPLERAAMVLHPASQDLLSQEVAAVVDRIEVPMDQEAMVLAVLVVEAQGNTQLLELVGI